MSGSFTDHHCQNKIWSRFLPTSGQNSISLPRRWSGSVHVENGSCTDLITQWLQIPQMPMDMRIPIPNSISQPSKFYKTIPPIPPILSYTFVDGIWDKLSVVSEFYCDMRSEIDV